MSSKYSIENAALLVIDMQRDNEAGNSWPVKDFSQVVANSKRVIDACRKADIPVLHSQHSLSADGSDMLKLEPRTPCGAPTHSVIGSPNWQFCDTVAPADGEAIIQKTRFTSFFGSTLDDELNARNVETLIIVGVWSEACVETTVWDAIWRDYKVVLVKDAIGTSNDFTHKIAVLDMANWIYGGAIYSTQEFAKALAAEDHKVWVFREPAAFKYDEDTYRDMYDSI